MAKFESTIRQINYPQQNVYNLLSDLSNIERIKDRLPEDKIKDLTFDENSISISSPMGAVKLNIIEREEPSCIKFETEKSPLPFNLWIQILPVDEASCKIKLTIKAELNPFIKGMVSKPLQEGIEKIADALQMIKYD
ncbi:MULTISPECIES: SRPBCC family protein [Prevotella]|uniref:Polyketide cyclase n=1 Tax=Prevotella herbatica TaxID=2801997 RepID=A0ABN6EGZ1_9BACT|nr:MULTISPECIES: SRPBCC family protein [Prevotella]MDN5553717.1 SRPBCC family protein [Prevotella sp.]BCS85186.1 polyketide cyclase [Prevotella herbatica]